MRFTYNDCQFGSFLQCLILHLLNRPDDNNLGTVCAICLTMEQVAVKINILPKRDVAEHFVGCKIPYLPVYQHTDEYVAFHM